MRAAVGDRLLVHGRTVGASDQTSEIIEVRGPDGTPPYLVRHPDGQEALVFPGQTRGWCTRKGRRRPRATTLPGAAPRAAPTEPCAR